MKIRKKTYTSKKVGRIAKELCADLPFRAKKTEQEMNRKNNYHILITDVNGKASSSRYLRYNAFREDGSWQEDGSIDAEEGRFVPDVIDGCLDRLRPKLGERGASVFITIQSSNVLIRGKPFLVALLRQLVKESDRAGRVLGCTIVYDDCNRLVLHATITSLGVLHEGPGTAGEHIVQIVRQSTACSEEERITFLRTLKEARRREVTKE